jgi:hypothetical protein
LVLGAALAPPPAPNAPGRNAPGGLQSAWPGYDGSVLPAASLRGDARNRFGSNSFGSQAKALSLVNDPGNPTGSGRSLRIPFPGVGNPDWPTVFTPDDFGGQAPVRFGMQSDFDKDRRWTELYVRIVYRISPGFSSYGRAVSATAHAAGTASGGSMTTMTDAKSRWRPNEHTGRFVKVAGVVRRIASNTATTLTLAPPQQFTYAPNGERYQILSFAKGERGWNAGTKLFFPRLSCRLKGVGVDRVGPAGDNNYVGLWSHFDGKVEGSAPVLGMQINRTWNGVARNAKGMPQWQSSGLFGLFPNAERPDGYKPGQWLDAEYYFKVNTPGEPNGVYTVWHNGAPLYHATNVTYAPKWVPQERQNGLDAARCTDPRWAYVWMDPTFGGGYHIPEKDQDLQIRGWYIGGK